MLTTRRADAAVRPAFARMRDELALGFNVYVKEPLLLKRPAERFYRTFGGHIFFEALRSAAKLDVFTLLDDAGPLPIGELRAKLGIEEQPCRILLLALVATGLLKKKRGDRYANTRSSKWLLSRNSRQNVTAYVEAQHHIYFPSIFHLYDSVKANRNLGVEVFPGTEPTLYQRLERQPELQKMFQDAMQELSRHSNAYLAKYLDLSGVSYLVDVGGGNATNIIALAENNPHLRAAVFDFPGVQQLALENIAAKGLGGRLTAMTGNAFTDAYPTGADCFLFCHFFTMWSKAEDLGLLKQAFAALPSGGRAIIFNMMQRDDGKGPLSAALGSPYFLACATGRGMLYAWSEYVELFRQAGFVDIRKKRLPRDHGVIIGIKP